MIKKNSPSHKLTEKPKTRIKKSYMVKDYYLTAAELAKYLYLRSTTDIYQAVAEHAIPFVMLNETPHFPKMKIDRWILSGQCAKVLPHAKKPDLEMNAESTLMQIKKSHPINEIATENGYLTGIATDLEINLHLTPEHKFKLSGNQLQKIKFDLNIISQNLIDFLDRFLRHYLNGGTMASFEE